MTWGALTLTLTLLAGAYTWYAFRNRGTVAGLRGAGVTLIPLALLLTDTLRMVTRIGSAISSWALHLAWNPFTWLGIVLALGAGTCWVGYILLSVRTGQRFGRLGGLAIAMAVAALAALPLGAVSAGAVLLDPGILLIGLGGLSAPLWLRRVARDTLYVITSQRALVLEGRQAMVRSWPPEALIAVTCSERPDGSGDLLFATEVWDDGRGNRGQRQRGFFAVRDVRMARACLERLAATRR